jgi:hypothetical protein
MFMRPGLWIQFQKGQLVSLCLLTEDPDPFTLAMSLVKFVHLATGETGLSLSLAGTHIESKRLHLIKTACAHSIGDLFSMFILASPPNYRSHAFAESAFL